MTPPPSNGTRPLPPPLPSRTVGIVDIHAGDGVRPNLELAQRSGMVALIHKASEGVGFRDRGFVRTITEARSRGLLCGLYAFGTNEHSGIQQADYFLDRAAEVAHSGDVLLALDFEPNPNPDRTTMDVAHAVDFVTRVHELAGVWPLFYGGLSNLRAKMARASAEQRAVLANCSLWLAAYGPDPLKQPPPAPWTNWSLFQYSDQTYGPANKIAYPRTMPGFLKCDRSVYRGSVEELRAWWSTCSW